LPETLASGFEFVLETALADQSANRIGFDAHLRRHSGQGPAVPREQGAQQIALPLAELPFQACGAKAREKNAVGERLTAAAEARRERCPARTHFGENGAQRCRLIRGRRSGTLTHI
jgi:hypothetical protein